MKPFIAYFWGVIVHPRATFDALAAERTVRWGIPAAFLGTFQVWGNMALHAVFGLNWLGSKPLLADPTFVAGFGYWRVNAADFLPVFAALMPLVSLFGLLVTAGLAHLMSKLWGGHGAFEQMVNTLSFAGAVPMIALGATTEWIFGVPISRLTGEPYWWVDAMQGKFGIISTIWNIYMWGVYFGLNWVWGIALGSLAIRRVQKIPPWAAVITMVFAFVVVYFLDSAFVR